MVRWTDNNGARSALEPPTGPTHQGALMPPESAPPTPDTATPPEPDPSSPASWAVAGWRVTARGGRVWAHQPDPAGDGDLTAEHAWELAGVLEGAAAAANRQQQQLEAGRQADLAAQWDGYDPAAPSPEPWL
jgi:hypothetical protein